MSNRIEIGGLKVDEELYTLVNGEIAPGTGVDTTAFWDSLGKIVTDLAPLNRELLEKRDALQQQIDAWHVTRKGQPIDGEAYKCFLSEIGYLQSEGDHFEVTTANVDPEVASVAGPQLVVRPAAAGPRCAGAWNTYSVKLSCVLWTPLFYIYSMLNHLSC